MVKLFANSGDPDPTPHSVVSDLGVHCLPITLLRVSRLQWVKLLLQVLHNFAKGVIFNWQEVASLVFEYFLKNGATLKGKNLLPLGANSLL